VSLPLVRYLEEHLQALHAALAPAQSSRFATQGWLAYSVSVSKGSLTQVSISKGSLTQSQSLKARLLSLNLQRLTYSRLTIWLLSQLLMCIIWIGSRLQ